MLSRKRKTEAQPPSPATLGSPHRRSPRRRSPRGESSPAHHRSSHRGSSPARDRSPRHKISQSHRGRSPEKEKHSSHTKSPKQGSSLSPISRSPSPRTKRLKRAQVEGETEKVKDREVEKNRNREKERNSERERVSDREKGVERGRGRERERERGLERETAGEKRERHSGRGDTNGKSSRGRHKHSTSPSDHHQRRRHRSRSPLPGSDTRDREEVTNSRGSEHRNGNDDSVAKMNEAEAALEANQKQKPSFELSGKLAAETNRVRGVTLLFNEPPEARKPDIRWRLYVFKAGEVLNEPLYIHRQSCYLFGRERRVADIPTDHPSCSKQHAVIQFRLVEKEQPDGMLSKQVRPYLMDLGSTNKTYLNDNPIEPQRYYEIFEKDTIKFGNSSREYVLLHENSAQ